MKNMINCTRKIWTIRWIAAGRYEEKDYFNLVQNSYRGNELYPFGTATKAPATATTATAGVSSSSWCLVAVAGALVAVAGV